MRLHGTVVAVGVVGLIAVALYPIAIDPKLHPEKYRASQKRMREIKKERDEAKPKHP
ncbi:hypothetical protein TrispH2_011008 [Trichoplax sp. H2]|nr:hypothetical protein TrispH2_011008 [Trichoplax sp. H2]|eukprot:RDD37152.1 hypothetical protein TrispH2_011008 [Trichoplax sp. H2]